MKRLTLLLLLVPFWCFGQAVPGCGTFTNHATITLSNVSNQTISGDSINAAGGQFCIRLTNCTNIHITKCKLINASTASYSGAVDIHGGSNITVDTCYFENDSYGILVQAVTNGFIVNNYNYFKNCEQVGRPTKGGCSIQWNGVSGGGLRANYNKSYHTTNNVNIGDQFSFFKVNGLSTDYMQHFYNECEGGSTESTGLAGTVLGDLGGSFQDGEFNTYVTAGMEGCQVQGGHDIIMSNNRIYSNRLPVSTVGLAFGNYTNPFVASYNITMANNKINFINAAGQTSSIWFDPNTAFAPNGWNTNTPAGKADPTITAAMLPVPLFGTCSVTVPIPIISYTPATYTFTTGTAIASIIPTNTGGGSNQWSVSPALPTGLVISATTGIISGNPSTVTTATNYTVSALNGGGTGTTVINIKTQAPVIVKPSISYSPNTITKTVNTAITPLSASNTGGAITTWSVSPSVPTGITFNSGTFSGTPSVVQTAVVYTVTASNSSGSSNAGVTITVLPVKPSISYAGSPFTFTQNSAIVPLSPANSGGLVSSYSVSPALVSGLSLNTSTGVISGTPSVTQSATAYNITAQNAGGSSVFPISISVIPPAVTPPNISYSPSSQTGTINVAITNMSPINVGGAATGFTISPALPASLNFSTSNGVISGTGTVVSGSTSYTIVGSNSGGSSTTHVTVAINQIPAPSISYVYSSVIYVQGQPITPISPTNSGGISTSYSLLSGTLPVGLSLSSTTGVVSGTPTATQSPTNFVVRAVNAGGNSDFTIQAAVNPAVNRWWYLIDGRFGYIQGL
jgi:hypothetical protein